LGFYDNKQTARFSQPAGAAKKKKDV